MSGRSRTVAAVLAFTLAAMLPATCPCPQQKQAGAGHECCAPPSAVRAAGDACCGGNAVTDALAAVAAPDLEACPPSSAVVIAPQRIAKAFAIRPTPLAASPPPLILRI